MKKFFAALLIVSMIGFVGCKEKSTEEQLKDKAGEMEKEGKEKMEKGKEEAGKMLDKVKE